MMLEVDFMTTEGLYDEALAQINEIISLSDGDDAIPHVFKANTLAQKVVTPLSCCSDVVSICPIFRRCFTFKSLSNTIAKPMLWKGNLS
jgi:hypothetical protein